MDDFQGFAYGDEPAENDYNEGAVAETPPSVGRDERRMHVRAYNYWVSLLKGRSFPGIEDLDPESLSDFGPHSVLMDFTGGYEDPALQYVGSDLRSECGIEGAISRLSDVPSRTLLTRLTDHYMQIIANRAPVGFEAEFLNQRGSQILYRGILMPFSTNDEDIDFIYGVINWKEVADRSLTEELVLEVEEAIRSTPKKHAVVPIWADGPSAAGVEAAPDPADPSSDSLENWLSAARSCAREAAISDARSHQALYAAIGRAHDFACATRRHGDPYAAMLAAHGLKSQDRAPMTPIVKLVFGADYDKTRLTEYAAALSYAEEEEIPAGVFAEHIAGFPGGLKAIVREQRARRAQDGGSPRFHRLCAQLRAVAPIDLAAVDGDEEFVVLLARREQGGVLSVVGVAGDEALTRRAMTRLR